MQYSYNTRGVCSRRIDFDIKDGTIQSLSFDGGCNGSLKGISKLVTGMKAEDAISLLSGTDCKGRGTSCPDQLSIALSSWLEKNS